MGARKRLHNEKLRNLYASPNTVWGDQIKEGEVGGSCSTHGESEKCIKILVGEPEWKRSLRRPRRRWENNNTMYLREITWEGVDPIYQTQDRDQWEFLVNMVLNLWVP
jgi:hypothetical protein